MASRLRIRGNRQAAWRRQQARTTGSSEDEPATKNPTDKKALATPDTLGAGQMIGHSGKLSHDVSSSASWLFAGSGMARVGLSPKWRCVIANDICAKKARAYSDNFGADEVIVGDVADLFASQIPTIDLAWASTPCQDLSLGGGRKGLDGERSGAVWSFLGLMRDMASEGRAPRLIVIENVVGFLTARGGADFRSVCNILVELGYQVAHCVLDAADFLPQSRPRVFIIASRAGFPPELLDGDRLRLPRPSLRNIQVADLLEPDDAVAWHAPQETHRQLTMLSEANLAKLADAKRLGRRVVGTGFRRMREGQQRLEIRFDAAGCLRVATGDSSRQQLLVVDGENVHTRLLTPRECARLMGLSDNYVLPAIHNESLTLIGDAIAIPCVRYLAEHVLEPLLQSFTPIAV